MLIHRHILLTARGLNNPPRTTEHAIKWLQKLTELVEMKIFFGPEAKRCDVLGNEGVTGLVCIETSHASMHCWDAGIPFIQCDLYSCAHFDTETVINHVREFEPSEIEYMLIDRSNGYKILEHFTIN